MTQKVKNHPFRGFLTYSSVNQTVLFEFDFGAYFFELSFQSFSIGFGEAFLDNAGCAVYHFFGFLQAETGKLLNELNDFQFFATGSLEDYVERRFFFSSSTCSSGTCSNSYSSSGGFDAVFVFENLGKFVYFLDSEVYELFSKSF